MIKRLLVIIPLIWFGIANNIVLYADSNSVSFCMNPNALKAMRIMGTVINILKILIPVIITIVAIIKFVKVVISGDDEKAAVNNIFQKVIIGAAIFFIPILIGIIFNNVKGYDKTKAKFADCGICLTNSSSNDCQRLINTAQVRLEARNQAEAERRERLLEQAHQRAETERARQAEQLAASVRTPSVGGISNSFNMPYYNQGSPGYASIALSSGRVYPTSSCGCGYTSLAMVIDGITGQNNTPVGIVKYFDPSSYAADFCPIYDSTLVNSQIKTHFGVNYNMLFSRSVVPQNGADAEARKQVIMNSLSSNHAIVLLVPGHYIALAGLNNGKVVVLDPGNSANNGLYTIDDLWNKYYNHGNRCTNAGSCGFMYAVEYS